MQTLYLCDAQGRLDRDIAGLFSSHFLQCGLNDEGENGSPRELHPFYEELLEGVLTNLEAIDSAIGLASVNWSVARMALVERNIIRVAVYEILFRSDVPVKCAINEAIEIAKDFASPEGPTFINGVLDKVANQRAVQDNPIPQRVAR
jgi:N utilization substance protein B